MAAIPPSPLSARARPHVCMKFGTIMTTSSPGSTKVHMVM
jgi:hypothetical protein